MVDNGCCTYGIITEKFVRLKGLPRIEIPQIIIEGVNGQRSSVGAITEFTLDVGGLKQQAAAYVVPSAYGYDMILGKTWLERVGGIIDNERKTLTLLKYGIAVQSTESQANEVKHIPISAAAFQHHVRQSKIGNKKI